MQGELGNFSVRSFFPQIPLSPPLLSFVFFSPQKTCSFICFSLHALNKLHS